MLSLSKHGHPRPWQDKFHEFLGLYSSLCRRVLLHWAHRNLEKRVAEHQVGDLPGYTLSRRPVALVFSEAFTTREEALACERWIKGWSRQKKEAMMRGDWEEVAQVSQGRASFDRLQDGRTGNRHENQGPACTKAVLAHVKM